MCLILFLSVVGCSDVKKKYYDNEILKSKCQYKNNKKEGLSKFYYKSGDLLTECIYNNGKKRFVKTYSKNGEIAFMETYKNGQVQTMKVYDERGKLYFEHKYPYAK